MFVNVSSVRNHPHKVIDSSFQSRRRGGIRLLFLTSPLLFLLFFVPVQYIEQVPIKSYTGYTCGNIIRSFAQIDYTSIRAIRIMPHSVRYNGYYHLGGVIDLYGNCDREVLRHELAHHKQYLAGLDSYYISNHINFNKYLELVI